MFQFIEVKGSHREIGRSIGESLRNKIGKSLTVHFERFQKQKDKNAWMNFQTLKKTVERKFPDYVEEIKGIAEGANEKFEKLLFFSFEEELSPGEKCTTVALKGKDTIFFAHNEDWDIRLPLYIIKAKPNKKPAFTSAAYAGHFPGTVVGYNPNGLLFSGNSIDTKFNYLGIPKTFFLRSFLECRSIKDAVDLVKKNKRALGNNSVLVDVQEKEIATLEWSSNKISFEKNILGIGHANHFILQKMKCEQISKTSQSSKGRYFFVQEKILRAKNPSLSEIKKIMKTHVNSRVSICGHKLYKTLSSIVVDVSRGEMYVSDGNPCKNSYKKYNLH